MMISQSALMCLEATWLRMMGHVAADLELDPAPAALQGSDALDLATDLQGEVVYPIGGTSTTIDSAIQPGRVGNKVQRPDVAAPLTADERRARAAALRALALSRGRRFDAARTAFIEAARLDPILDLTRVPGFWKLERAAHEAAIDAYQNTGRERDAAVLRARVRSTYRPKPMRPRTGAVLSS